MKTSSLIQLKLVHFLSFLGIIILAYSCSGPSTQSFRVFAVSDLKSVFEDGYKLPEARDTIVLFGIRAEVISAQCVIHAENNLTAVSVKVSEIKNQLTGNTLPANVLEWNFVGSIPLSKNTTNQPQSVLVRQAPARFPEYLMSERQINIREKTYQPVWLTINIPENAEAGRYQGNVTIQCGQGEKSLSVNLMIYPLRLPAERHLKVTEWYNTGNFARFHGIQEKYSEPWFAMLRTYAENMAAHRQNVFEVPLSTIIIKPSKNSRLEFDFTRFDQMAQVFWDTKKMDFLETGGLAKFGDKAWFSTDIILNDFILKDETGNKADTLAGKLVLPYLLPAFQNHLEKKGWLNKTLFHVRDEPSVHNAIAWKELSSYVHKLAPKLRRIDAIETTYLLDDIEIAVPKLDALGSWYDTYKKWQQKGNELWFYTVGIYQGSLLPNKTIDMPVMDSRIMHWLNYKFDISGYLHWGWNQWNENPFQEVGEHIGDAWHVYPAKDGVLNSLRWEQMRNGLQDYEYFWLLENEIKGLKDSLGTEFSWIDPKQRGKEIAGRVVMELAKHTDDPNVLYKAKMDVIGELLKFSKSPLIYVQVNPKENSELTGGSSVEVLGWTEPGTKIVVNGQELPVRKEGLFMEQFGLSIKDNVIKVQASNAKGSKEIVREFVVK